MRVCVLSIVLNAPSLAYEMDAYAFRFRTKLKIRFRFDALIYEIVLSFTLDICTNILTHTRARA